jgi:hypothetical protein
VEELIYDLANLDGGFAFAARTIGGRAARLAMACRTTYGLQSIPGYLESGVPPEYGAGDHQTKRVDHRLILRRH